MKNRCINGITFTLLFAFCSLVQAASPVWKVSHEGHHLYLGGTLHLLTKADFPLPSGFDEAYQDSHTVVLETDIAAVHSTDFQQTLLSQTTYSGSDNLTRHLSEDTLKRLRGFLEKRGMPTVPLFRFKPAMLSVTLTLIELQRLGFTEAGVDEYYLARALEDGKALGYLETPDDQIRFLSEMGQGHEDELIHHTLDEIRALPEQMKAMKAAWRSGDLARLETVGLDDWPEQFPDVYDAMLVKRNHNWIPHIERLLRTRETELVLFGALHLVGDDGVLSLLKNNGYEVTRLD